MRPRPASVRHRKSTPSRRRRAARTGLVVLPTLAAAATAVTGFPQVSATTPASATSIAAEQQNAATARHDRVPIWLLGHEDASAPADLFPGRTSARASRGTARAPLAPARRTAHTKPRPAHRPAHRPTWIRPDVGALSSPYGSRWGGEFHPGIDLAGPWGSPIRAAADGVIEYAGPASGFGQMIKVRHAGGIETVYGHMSTIVVRSGRVRAGQVIALEGSEGRSTGPHLHFEVYINGTRVDPLPFLRRHGVRI